MDLLGPNFGCYKNPILKDLFSTTGFEASLLDDTGHMTCESQSECFERLRWK